MTMKAIMIGGLAAMLVCGCAAAQDQPPAPRRPDGHRGGGWTGRPEAPLTRTEAEQQAAARFARLDTNHDGVVTRAELDSAHAALRTERAERRQDRRGQTFDRLDANKDGMLSRQEFTQAAPPAGMPPHRAGRDRRGSMRMQGMMEQRWFDRADADHDGMVTLAEAKASALALFDRIDLDHDGTISPNERRTAMRAMRAQGDRARNDAPPPQG